MALSALAWIRVYIRGEGLNLARGLSAAVIAAYVASIGGVVNDLLALRFPPGGPTRPYEVLWESAKLFERLDIPLSELGLFSALLPLVVALGDFRVRRARRLLNALAEGVTWSVVTLPLAWLWIVLHLGDGFHFSVVGRASKEVAALSVGPFIAAAAGSVAFILRWLARREDGRARLHWIVITGPALLLLTHAHWSAFFHARASLPQLDIDSTWCRLDGPPSVDTWPAGPELCNGREAIQIGCSSVKPQIALWQDSSSGSVVVSARNDGHYRVPPSAAALSALFSEAEDGPNELADNEWQKSAAFWPTRSMTGSTIAEWVSTLIAAGVERVHIFARLKHVEVHPLYGELVRYQSCPLGYLVLDDLDAVRRWSDLDVAVNSGAFRALQGTRPHLPIRGDDSHVNHTMAKKLADVPR